jgi:hypothetical protein
MIIGRTPQSEVTSLSRPENLLGLPTERPVEKVGSSFSFVKQGVIGAAIADIIGPAVFRSGPSAGLRSLQAEHEQH